MKKTLILAYDFPPYNSIGGQRPYSWFKYLKEYGIETIVITRHWSNDIRSSIDYLKPSGEQTEYENSDSGLVIRIPFKPNLRDRVLLKHGFNNMILIRKLLTIVFQLGEFLFPIFDNKKGIYKEANLFLKKNKVDTIIATSEPFILFKHAARLSKKHNIPWIADYRDGWSTNYNRGKFEKYYYNIIEKNILKSCSAITTVSEEFKDQLASITKLSNINVIRNGFIPELFNNLKHTSSNQFTIGFAGTIYPYQPIEMFAKAFRAFCKKHPDVLIKFLGSRYYPENEKRIINSFAGLEQHIQLTERLAHSQALEELNSCQLLLLPASKNHAQLYAKTFDYLALNKCILLFEDDLGALSNIIRDTNSGIICNTKDEIENTLHDKYTEWQKTGKVECNSKNIDKYSRKEQTKKLAEILNSL